MYKMKSFFGFIGDCGNSSIIGFLRTGYKL